MRRNVSAALPAALVAVAVALGPSAPARAAAQEPWVSQVRHQLVDSRLVHDWLQDGFRLSHDPQFGVTRALGRAERTFVLRGNWRYRFIGKCDDDCTDLDLELYDPRGRKVAEDLRGDDFPAVQVVPAVDGVYTLRVTMARCETRDCGWGVVAFRR